MDINIGIEKALSTAAAAAYLTKRGFDIRPQTLRLWRTRHRGPCYVKASGHVRYRPSQLEEFLAASVVNPTADKPRRGSASRTTRGSR